MRNSTIVLSAGGTGGHLFPAEALGHELRQRGYDVHLATDERAQRFAGAFDADHIHVIRSATISGRNPIAVSQAFYKLWQGNLDSRRLFKKLKPALVAGFGGYPTLPPLYAACRMGIPTLIHEQNAVMGRANKALAGKVNAIAGGFYPKIVVPMRGKPFRPAIRFALPYWRQQKNRISHLPMGYFLNCWFLAAVRAHNFFHKAFQPHWH